MKKTLIFLLLLIFYHPIIGQESPWDQVHNTDQLSEKALLLESIFEENKYENIQISDSSARYIISISKLAMSDTLEAKGYQLLAKAKLIQSQYDSCKIYIDYGCNALSEGEKTSNQAAFLYKLHGLLFYYKGEYNSSLEKNFLALDIWKRLGRTNEQAKVYNNIGICYERLKEYEKALSYYEKGLNKVSPKNKKQRAIFMNNMSVLLVNLKKYEEAETTLLKAKEITIDIEYEPLLVDLNGSLSEIYVARKEVQKGIQIAEENVSLLRNQKDYVRLVRNLNMLGSQLNATNQAPKAILHLKEAQELSTKYSIGEHKMEIFENLVNSYRMIGDFENTSIIQDSFISYKQNRFNKEKNQITEELNIKYETAEKDKNLLVSEQNLWKRTIQRNSLIVGLFLIAGFIYLIWNRNKQRNRLNEQQLYIKEQQVKQLVEEKKSMALSYTLEGQELERNRIAQDLHDGLGGLLASVKNHFSLINDEIELPENKDIYKRTNNMIDEACSEVRRISHNLMPTGLKIHGLKATVEDLCNSLNLEQNVPIKFETMGQTTSRLDETIEIFAYRIIQEGVNNCLKHAKASRIMVQLGFYENELQLVIEDNGLGFDQSKTTEGIGLHSMQSRVEFLKGTIDIDSKKNEGTTISINIPCNG